MSDHGGGGGGGGGAARAEGQYATARTSVWWDIENCAVPRNCDPHLIALNIGSALENLGYRGRVSISAYGDTNKIPDSVQRALNNTGVSLNHIPAGVKDASDKKILVDMLFWAVDNPPPSNYLLISGDRDFSNALHQLGLRKYNVLLAQPQCVSSALVAAAKSVWEWPSLVAGGPPMSQIPEACKSSTWDSVKASQPFVFSGISNASGSGSGTSANNGNVNGSVRAANIGNVKADNNRYKVKKNPSISISRVPSNEFRPPVPESSSRSQSPACKPTSSEGLDAKQFNDTGHHAFIANMPKGSSGPSYTPTHSNYSCNTGIPPFKNGNTASNDTGHHAFVANMPKGSSGPSYTPTQSDYSGDIGTSPFENGNTASNNQLRPRDLFPQNGNLTTLNSQNTNPPSNRPISNLQNSNLPSSRPSGPPPNNRPGGATLPPQTRPVNATFPPHTRPCPQPINLQHARSAPPFTPYLPANLAPYPPANLPNINYLNISGYPNGAHHNAPSFQQGPVRPNDLHSPQHFAPGIFPRSSHPTGIDNSMFLHGFSGTPAGAAFPPNVLDSIGNVVLDIIGNVLSTLKNEKIPPTEANIADCILYGEMNIQYFDVRNALNYALRSQYLAEHKLGKRPPYYTKKREPLWKCVQECIDNKYPKETWDSIQKYLSSAEGQFAMQSSQCRYQAAISLKTACLKTFVLGDVLQLLNVIINCKKWILPHATGWQPLSVTCPNTDASDASSL